jgi:glycosyltransferase involved in cell wall biosynthesis
MKNDKRIRVLQITHDLRIGGLQKIVSSLCKNLDPEKFECSVLCLRDLGEYACTLQDSGVKTYLLKKSRKPDYFAFIRISKFIKRGNYDLIHTHNSQPFIDGTMACLLARKNRIIHTEHGREFPDKIRYMVIEFLLSKFVYKIVAVSQATAKNLRKFEKISSKTIQIIPNGVDLQPECEGASNNVSLSDFQNNFFIIGVCARLSKEKGIRYLLEAMPIVHKKYSKIMLVIAGDGEIRNELECLARKLKIDDIVIFLGNRLDVYSLIKRFDVLVLPSISEGLPLIILEAFGSGCPVIASSVGGIPSIIKHGVNGSLVQPQKPQELAKEILKLYENLELREKYSENGLKVFKDQFTVQKMINRYEELYSECISNTSQI